MSAIEAPGAPTTEDSRELSSFNSSIGMVEAPPNSPHVTRKHEKEQRRPLSVDEDTSGNLSNLSEFNIDCYFDTSSEYQGGSRSTVVTTNADDTSRPPTKELTNRKSKSKFRGTHQRKSSEQLSSKSIRLLTPILPRSATPPPILSPGLMESVTDAVTGIFYEPSIMLDHSSLQLDNTEDIIQMSWPNPPETMILIMVIR
ncbi:hypothetical protein BDF22DRAFT_652785 [Syncephalis plumigaleata]|nr:hypothetical protein BDF22DRAFT_652785 [Syncephalis plumigaleata]